MSGLIIEINRLFLPVQQPALKGKFMKKVSKKRIGRKQEKELAALSRLSDREIDLSEKRSGHVA